jgi:hypothetical protein
MGVNHQMQESNMSGDSYLVGVFFWIFVGAVSVAGIVAEYKRRRLNIEPAPELDPQLLALFASSRDSLSDADFLTATLTKIEQQLRLRALYRGVAVIAAIVASALLLPWLLEHTAHLFSTALAAAQRPVDLAASPWAWVASVPIGLLLIFRSVGSRR